MSWRFVVAQGFIMCGFVIEKLDLYFGKQVTTEHIGKNFE